MKTETELDNELLLEDGNLVKKDSEIEDLEEETVDDGENAGEKEADKEDSGQQEESEKEKWNRDKQMIEFERGNARRAREELNTVSQAYQQATDQLEALKAEVEELKTEKKTAKLEEMDPEMADEKVIKNIKLIENRLSEKEKAITEMSKKIADYEKQQEAQQRQTANEQAKLDVYTTVEDMFADFGVKNAVRFRNDAIKLADDLVDSGEKMQPTTFKQAVKLMKECYLQVKEKADKSSKKKTVSVDTGKGGTGSTGDNNTGIKPGPLKDVAAQMLKNRSWLK